MNETKAKARFIRLEEVMHRTGLKKTSIYSKMKAQGFPQKIDLGGNSVAWLESDIDDWINQKLNQQDNAK